MDETKRSFFIDVLLLVAAFFLGMLVGSAFNPNVTVETSTPEPTQTIVYNIYCTIPEDMKKTEEPEEQSIEEKIIQQPLTRDFDIFTPCGYTKEELLAAVSDTSTKSMHPHIESFIKAEEQYGVNAFYLMCKLGLESGWAKHESGKNNIAGWTNNTGGFKDFASVEECILHVAKVLSTTYKEKVGGRLEDVCKRYCPNPAYPDTLLGIMQDREAMMNAETT